MQLIAISKSPVLSIEQLDAINGQEKQNIITFLKISQSYKSQLDPDIRGPDALAWDFYHHQGGCDKSAVFLFGEASQHR